MMKVRENRPYVKQGSQLIVHGKRNSEQPITMSTDILKSIKVQTNAKHDSVSMDTTELSAIPSGSGDAILYILPESVLKQMDTELILQIHKAAEKIGSAKQLQEQEWMM